MRVPSRATGITAAKSQGGAAEDEFLAVDLDLRARPLAEQDAVARLHVQGGQAAALVARARAHGQDLAFHRLFLGGVGNDDACRRALLFLDAPEQNAVMQGPESHLGLLSKGS